MSICKSAEEYAEKHIKDGVFEDGGWCPDGYVFFKRAVHLAGQSFGCKVYVGWRKLFDPRVPVRAEGGDVRGFALWLGRLYRQDAEKVEQYGECSTAELDYGEFDCHPGRHKKKEA